MTLQGMLSTLASLQAAAVRATFFVYELWSRLRLSVNPKGPDTLADTTTLRPHNLYCARTSALQFGSKRNAEAHCLEMVRIVMPPEPPLLLPSCSL